jgi:hypothetical protein
MFGREKYRILRSFYLRPVLPFALEFLLLAPLALGVDAPGMTSLYLFLSPWLLLALALLNLPFARFALESFRLDLPTRRNHSLEHATILILRARGHRRAAGKASAEGFRVSGGPSAQEIRAAFEVVCRQVSENTGLAYVSATCGSNRVTALALGLALLMIVTILSVLARPPLLVRASALVGVVLLFVSIRHAVGNWLQKRWFMATDFSAVSLRDIRKVKTPITDVPPTYFVETLIRVE